MRTNDVLGMSFRNLWRRKTRTILTTLGVVIGSASIILMISVGIGYQQSFQEALDKFGNIRMIEVYKSYSEKTSDNQVKLNDELIAQITAVDGVKSVMEFYSASGQITVGKYQNYAHIYGVDISKLAEFQIEVGEGQLPQPGDSALIVGAEFANEFYDPRATSYMPITVDLFNESFRLYLNGMHDNDGNIKRPIRIDIAAQLMSSGYDDYSVYMDKEALIRLLEDDERRYGGNSNNGRPTRLEDREYENIKVLCHDIDDVQPVTDVLKSMGVEVYSPIEFVNQQQQQIQMMQALLGGIGGISLLVAAIGITNTMIMSIYERTREIGVMKVLGAELKDIMRMFLVEAAVIGFIGGLFGIVLSYGGSFGLNHLSETMGSGDSVGMMGMGLSKSVIPMQLALLALAFSTVIGLVAGIFPAMRATRLSALEAIRNE